MASQPVPEAGFNQEIVLILWCALPEGGVGGGAGKSLLRPMQNSRMSEWISCWEGEGLNVFSLLLF